MTNPIALDLLKLAEHYLSALHGSAARHDNIGLNLSCGGCALRDEIRDVLPKLAAAVSVPPPAPRADDQAAVLEERDSYHRWLKEAETARDEARLQLSRVIGERNRLAAEVDNLLQQEADRIVAHCPDHGTADGVWMDCHCAVADDMRRNAVGPCVAGEQQNETPEAATVHAVPLPGSNGISSCCGRPPCEFVGERVTRDPDKVTCTGPTAGVRQNGTQQ